jgi:predicted dehydrogenase
MGIIGIGNMGTSHAKNLYEGKVKGAVLTAICDTNMERIEWARDYFDDSVFIYNSFESMIEAHVVDALIIATPHYSHPELGIKTLEANLHVLVEKPIGVYTQAVEKLNDVAAKSEQVFTIMYNQRTLPIYQKVKELIVNGEIGELIRVNWIMTTWFRSQYYYDSGGWRATWEGEGGGVLLNQCPHQIDLLQWLCGMPVRVRSFCDYGKYHEIEVEDDVTAFFEYENGATGVFITSTGEAPGTNRLEISGEYGNIVVENNSIVFRKNADSVFEHSKIVQEGFKQPECNEIPIHTEGEGKDHIGIMEDFIETIQAKQQGIVVEQLSPGIEGIKGLTLSNAIHMSSWKNEWVTIPFDNIEFKELLQDKIRNSCVKKEEKSIVIDVNGSH